MDKINPLNQDQIDALKTDFEILTFPHDFILVYEDHVPNTGVALIEGEIELFKNSRVKNVIPGGHLLGVEQLLTDRPVSYGCRVKAKSKVVLLGKSDILKCGQNERSHLYPLLRGLIDEKETKF